MDTGMARQLTSVGDHVGDEAGAGDGDHNGELLAADRGEIGQADEEAEDGNECEECVRADALPPPLPARVAHASDIALKELLVRLVERLVIKREGSLEHEGRCPVHCVECARDAEGRVAVERCVTLACGGIDQEPEVAADGDAETDKERVDDGVHHANRAGYEILRSELERATDCRSSRMSASHGYIRDLGHSRMT